MDQEFLHNLVIDSIEKSQLTNAIFFANKLLSLEPSMKPQLYLYLPLLNFVILENPNYAYLLAKCYYLTRQYRRAIHLLETNYFNDLRCRYFSSRCRVCVQYIHNISIIIKYNEL